MNVRFLTAVLLALPLPAAALVSARMPIQCHATDVACSTPENSDESKCCQQGTKAPEPKQTNKTDTTRPVDPDHEIVFKVEGLSCPAVKGIGCGHMLCGLLTSLDKVDGVLASSANYTGTMLRISVTKATDREKIAAGVRKVLNDEHRSAVAVAGDELKRALDREEWRGAERIGELSAIEFHTLALHRFKTFAKAEKLDKKTTDQLMALAEKQWTRISKEAKADGATRPEDWGKRIKASFPIFLEGATHVLSAEQVERFKQTLTGQCAGDDCPEAPPAPRRAEKQP